MTGRLQPDRSAGANGCYGRRIADDALPDALALCACLMYANCINRQRGVEVGF